MSVKLVHLQQAMQALQESKSETVRILIPPSRSTVLMWSDTCLVEIFGGDAPPLFLFRKVRKTAIRSDTEETPQ